jgi:hypothetical protein
LEDEKIFRQVHKIASNLKTKIESSEDSKDNPHLTQLLIDLYDKLSVAPYNTIGYNELTNTDATYSNIEFDNFIYSYEELSDSLTYDSTPYTIVVSSPNIDKANKKLLPIIAIGTDIQSDLDELDDFIPAWRFNGNSGYKKILINEEFAYKTRHPVLIFNVGTNNSDVAEYNKNKKNGLVSKDITKSINCYNVRFVSCGISERYESDRKSEYGGHFFRTINGGSALGFMDEKSYVKIHKNDLNEEISINARLYPTNQILADKIYGITYEYDWYILSGHLVVISTDPLIAAKCRMKYEHEWYQKVNYLDLENGSFKFIYSKGMAYFRWPV